MKFLKICAALLCIGTPASSSIVGVLSQDANDVLLDLSGSWDLTDHYVVTSRTFNVKGASVDPSRYFGSRNGKYQFWKERPNFTSFQDGIGPETVTSTTDVTDESIFFNFTSSGIGLPISYTSGAFLTAKARFASTTIADMGFSNGTFIWNMIGNQSITLVVGTGGPTQVMSSSTAVVPPPFIPSTVPVPLPAAASFLLTGVAALGLARRSKR